jgi:hypothetical protein
LAIFVLRALDSCRRKEESFINKENDLSLLQEVDGYMRKKGETSEQDRTHPQPQKKKGREKKRKDRKLARLERQQSRARAS